MCTKKQFSELLQKISAGAREIYKDELHSVILYGSYARGDFDDESDVDVMILVDIPKERLSDFRFAVDTLCGTLLYDYGVVVSITERDTETYYKYVDILPFYQNIKKEGVRVA